MSDKISLNFLTIKNEILVFLKKPGNEQVPVYVFLPKNKVLDSETHLSITMRF